MKKFFDTVDHSVLIGTSRRKIKDENVIWLLNEIITSFSKSKDIFNREKGIPIGNLTSQLFANIYMNEFDQFVKQKMRIKYYLRYTDDFLVISEDKYYLEKLIPQIITFLRENLLLKIHEEKTRIRKINQGVEFLGYIAFNKYRIVRTGTRRRIMKKFQRRIEQYQQGDISRATLLQSLQSYLISQLT